MDWVRRWILHNLPLKLLALASALLLWSAVAEEPRIEVAHTVPVEFVNAPGGVAIIFDKVPEVQIWLSGPTRLVRDVASRDLHPMIDLSALPPAAGERTYSLTNSQIKTPQGIEVVQVVPSDFHLIFDVITTRTVKVAPRVNGNFAGISSVPETVTIQGPQARVLAIQQALTDPIDAGAVRGRQSFLTTAYVNDPLVRVLPPSAVRVTVVGQTAPAVSGERPSTQSRPIEHP